MAFNYYDELTRGGTQDWISYLSNHYMETHAPAVNLFKLDKEATDIDELYGGEGYDGARIYLPPFEIRMNYLDAGWTQQLGVDTMPYLEIQEEDTVFAVNFENMVNKLRELKTAHRADLFIEHTTTNEISAEKTNSNLIIKVNDAILQNFDLQASSYRTIKKLVAALNNLSGIKAYSEGENDISENLVNFKETRFRNKKLNTYSMDDTYANSTDIIEKGDLILTEKYFLYEIQSNIPAGNIGWDYSLMLLTANVRSLDKAELPNNWNDLIARREYGLRDKINME